MIRRFLAARALSRATARANAYRRTPMTAWSVRAQMMLDQRVDACARTWAAL